MAQKTSFVSPGVYSYETDLSQLPQAAAQIGAAFVGLTQKGAAFQPISVTNFGDFRTRFGGLNKRLYLPYAVREYLNFAPIATIVRVLGKGNPSNGYAVDCGRAFVLAFPQSGGINNTAASTFTASLSAIETVAVLRSRLNSAGNDITSTVSYTGNASSFSATIGGTQYNGLSLDRTLSNYIGNILGTDSTTAHLGDSATGVYVDAVLNYRVSTFAGSYTGSAYGSTDNPASGSATGIKYVTGGYKTGSTPIVVSQPFVSGTSVTVYNLFRFVSRTDGEASNKDVKVCIQDIQLQDATTPKILPKFTVQIRAYDDNDARPQILETFTCDLNPESDYYIQKVIGDRYYSVSISEAGGTPETVAIGDYPNKSNFVRVETYEGAPSQARPMGFRGLVGINPYVATLANGNPAYESDMPLKEDFLNDSGFKTDSVFPGFDFEGVNAIGYEDRVKGTFSAVDLTYGSRGFMIIGSTAESTTYTPSLSSAYNASLTSQFTLLDVTVTGSASVVTDARQFVMPLAGGFDGISPSKSYLKAINDGTLSAEYISALNTLANAREVDINLLVIPGVHTGSNAYNGQIPTRAVELCENRGDCFYIMDIGKPLDTTASNITEDAKDTSITEAVASVAGYNTSYAGTYYSWCRISDPDANGALIWVPPSVIMSGVYAYNDKVKPQWYAPAGFNRGNLNDALELRRRLTQTQSDTLYLGRINPLVSIVNQGNVAFGQKTLQKENTALNRINVRRLLLYLKKILAGIANQSLFEFNTPQQRQKLRNAITPILDKVVIQQGLTNYKLIIDETNNTADVIDRNELRGTLLLVPTRAIEIIVFNYVITRTGASFEETLQSISQ